MPTRRASTYLGNFVMRNFVTIFLIAFIAMGAIFIAVESYMGDFRSFYIAAQAARNHLNPYVDNSQYGPQFADAFVQAYYQGPQSRFIYPPDALFLFAPFAHLSYQAGRIVFAGLLLIMMGAIVLCLGDKYQVDEVWGVMCFISLPVLASIERGQIDILILMLLLLSFAGRDRIWGGVPLAVAISVKVFPVVMLLWFLLRKKFRAVLGTLVATILLTIVTAQRYGLTAFEDFYRNLRRVPVPKSTGIPVSAEPITWVDGKALLLSHRFAGGAHNPLMLLGADGAIPGLAIFLLLAFALHRRRLTEDVSYFAFLLAALVVNPILWTMGLVMYVPTCMLAVGRLRSPLLSCLVLSPLVVPSQIHFHGVGIRLVLALGILAWLLAKHAAELQEAPARESLSASPRR